MIDINVYHARANFTVDVAIKCEGPVTALFGPSGSGKTTLLNMVAGLVTPQRGRISRGDDVWFDSDRHICVPPHRRHIAYVFQDARLFPHFNVRHNLMFSRWARNPLQICDQTMPTKWDDVIDVLGLACLLERRPLTLSGGEQQRVAIGRALLSNPKMLIMDEPLAAVDAQRRDDILPYIELMQKHFSIPTLYVSHAREEVDRIANEIITLRDGRVIDVTRGSLCS
jgi:molybdate transport system ATP-binding protein